jgi:ribonucleoside-diphosphate reductase alpha chain
MKAEERPKVLNGETHKEIVGCGHIYVTVNLHEGKVFEVFAEMGKAGGCVNGFNEALARSISIGLRAGVDLKEYWHTLNNIGCNSPTFSEGEKISSCPDAISRVLKLYIKDEGK